MTRLPSTIRLDASDTVIFDQAAEPGEWAVPGGFAFWDDDTAQMSGKRRQAFRGGFLGLGSFGWTTLVEVAEASATDRAKALAALAAHIHLVHGAPDEAAARAAAEEADRAHQAALQAAADAALLAEKEEQEAIAAAAAAGREGWRRS